MTRHDIADLVGVPSTLGAQNWTILYVRGRESRPSFPAEMSVATGWGDKTIAKMGEPVAAKRGQWNWGVITKAGPARVVWSRVLLVAGPDLSPSECRALLICKIQCGISFSVYGVTYIPTLDISPLLRIPFLILSFITLHHINLLT